MIDTLYPAVECYKKCIADGVSEAETADKVKQAAIDGAESTKGMELSAAVQPIRQIRVSVIWIRCGNRCLTRSRFLMDCVRKTVKFGPAGRNSAGLCEQDR